MTTQTRKRKTEIKDTGTGEVVKVYPEQLSLPAALRRFADEQEAEYVMVENGGFGPRMRMNGRVYRATYSAAR